MTMSSSGASGKGVTLLKQRDWWWKMAEKPTSPETLVDLQQVQRRFGDVTAVDNLTLTLGRGEILGLYGPSGSGKTTTIRMILGVHLPTAGTIRIFGVPSHRMGARERERIGYAPQQFLYPATLAADETVAFSAGLYGYGGFGLRKAIQSVLEHVDLWDKRHYRVGSMSGGERTRVAIAAAMVHQPSLVFLDEPTSGLDPSLRVRMWDWFRELRDQGCSLLVTGHYLAEAEFCDRLAILVHGGLATLGSPGELRRRALGGDIVEVIFVGSMARAIDALNAVKLVQAIRVQEPNRLWVIVEEAGSALPLIVDGLRAGEVDLHSVKEIRPPFDEIYQELVDRNG